MVRESPVVGRRRGKPKRTPVGQFADAQLAATTEQLGGMVRKTKVGKSPKVAKNDICSICLNQIVVSVRRHAFAPEHQHSNYG